MIAKCCICGANVYENGSTDCKDEDHEIDLFVARQSFRDKTGLTPEEWLEVNDNEKTELNQKLISLLYEAKFLYIGEIK